MKARYVLIALLAITSMALGACAQPAPQAAPTPQVIEKVVEKIVTQEVKVVETQVVEKIVEATRAPEPKRIVSWYQYDQGNVDPKSDERAGNGYLRQAMPLFNKEFEGKWIWDNEYSPFNRIEAKVAAAVLAGAEVPDVVEIGGSQMLNLQKNGALVDLTDWAKAQKWYPEMDASALKICTAPDGRLYCIPTATRPSQVFVWNDLWPNGFPKTPEEMLKEGERLKAQGKYALTFFGSTAYDGDGANRAVFSTVASFGGGYDDGNGRIKLDTAENVAAIAWLREMVQRGYVPEIAFAGGFQEEQAFMDASAGAIPTGLFGYRYMNPLTAPNGTKYEKRSQEDMLDAIEAGDVYLAPMPAPEGKKGGCYTGIAALAIVKGAQNVEGAQEFINWTLSPEHNPDYVIGPGGGLPVLSSVAATERFQTKFYQQAYAVGAASNCKVTWPSVVDTTGAKKAIMNAVYKLIKTDPTADIATELRAAQDEFNKTVK